MASQSAKFPGATEWTKPRGPPASTGVPRELCFDCGGAGHCAWPLHSQLDGLKRTEAGQRRDDPGQYREDHLVGPNDTTNGKLGEVLRSSSIGAMETDEAAVLDFVAEENLVETAQIAPEGFPASLPPEFPAILPVEGDIRQVSIIMADLRGFTTFCERVSPGRTSRVLNEYLTAMVEVIFAQQGIVQDFVGDGILGVFGAPRPDPEHAWHAALSALQMQLAIRRLSGHWQREEAVSLSLGVAVHSGEVFAGTVGSPRQKKYAVVGDPVNTVARLEELNRSLGTEIVISGDTLALLRDRVDAPPRGLFSLRGRSHMVDVFELLGIREVPRCVAPHGVPSLTPPLAVPCAAESLVVHANGGHPHLRAHESR